LGTGAINRFLRPQDSIVYFEINPKVEELARTYFTYLDRPNCRVVVGDGRKSLEKEPDESLDVLVLDAFHGDAIPTHMLTREAGRVYERHLKPGGAVAAHITNAHVDLQPVIKGLGRAMSMAYEFHRTGTTDWALLKPGSPPQGGNIIEWTDDKSSILAVLKQRD
jgi:spermidine synthase